MLLVKALRDDKLLEAIRHYVGLSLGPAFAASPSASMEDIYADTNNFTPVVFILSKGSDPTGTTAYAYILLLFIL